MGSLWLVVNVKQPLPDISVNTIDGRSLSLHDYADKPLLITFWATTCSSCVHEIPNLIKLYQELHPQGLEIIAVAMFYDPPSQVIELAKRHNIPYPIALDIQGKVAQSFGGVQITPTNFLVSPNQDIIIHKIGAIDINILRHKIQQLLSNNTS